MIRVSTPFGFNQIQVGDIVISTCKVRISNPSEGTKSVLNTLAKFNNDVKVYEEEGDKVLIKFELVGIDKGSRLTCKVGNILKAHAQYKLDQKYSWVRSTISGVGKKRPVTNK